MKDLIKDLKFDMEDLDDIVSRIQYINTFDEVDIEEIIKKQKNKEKKYEKNFKNSIKISYNINK